MPVDQGDLQRADPLPRLIQGLREVEDLAREGERHTAWAHLCVGVGVGGGGGGGAGCGPSNSGSRRRRVKSSVP